MNDLKHLYLDFRKNSEKMEKKIRQLKELYPTALFPSLSTEDDLLSYFVQNVFPEGLLSTYYICNTSLKEDKFDFTIRPRIDGPRLQSEFPRGIVLCVRGYPSPLGHISPYVVIDRIIDISDSEKKSFEAEVSITPYWSEEKVRRNRQNNILDYDFISSLPEISKETRNNLIKWKDYLKWKREITKNNQVGLKFIQVDLIGDELHFYVVTKDESTFKALRRILSRNELCAFPLNFSTDSWNFTYKDVPNFKGKSKEAKIGEFKYTRQHDPNPDREIDCPWEDPLVMDVVFELDEEDQSVFEEYADTNYDMIRSNILDKYPKEGFLSISSIRSSESASSRRR